MKKQRQKQKDIQRLQLKVVELYDDVTQFSDQCAFLSDAFTAIPAQQASIEPETLGGMHHYARWLKTRILEIKQELRDVHEQLKALNTCL